MQEETAVVMDSWWNVDFAKNNCGRRKGTENPCFGEPTGEVKDYELQISTAWAADSACRGLKLVGFDSAQTSRLDNEIEFQLMLDYVPGETKQSWTMTSRKTLKVVATGTDNAKAAAHTICAVLNHKGGSVE